MQRDFYGSSPPWNGSKIYYSNHSTMAGGATIKGD
jgi:hypothetical protein